MAFGCITFFDERKGAGTIRLEGGGLDVTLAAHDLAISGIKALSEGQRVSFELDSGFNPRALNVRIAV